MTENIRILFVEDSENDCDLILEKIRDNGYQPVFERVETESEMHRAFEHGKWDIILCDHNLPEFDVFSALSLAKKKDPSIPFIVVSGTVSEEVAVKALRIGAKDYILKNNLTRLVPSIERELADVKAHAEFLRVEAELKAKETELRQAQKLEAIGQLAGGIAHDFNNLLAIILMQTEKAMTQIEDNDALRKLTEPTYLSLAQIKKSGERAAHLTRQLLAFSRRQVIQRKVINLNELILEIKSMLEKIIPENIDFSIELAPDLKNVKLDPVHFEQIVMNLLVNSRDALSSGGKISIHTANVTVNEETGLRMGVAAGPYVLLEVADNGHGMNEEIQKNIFTPFFTTKDTGKGTGLGLATVYGIVKQNTGFILVDSRENAGTSFKIYFPRTDEVPETSAITPQPAKVSSGHETILVAEDVEDLRELICEVLESTGYKVLRAKHGIEALNLVQSYKDPIDLVITDVVMPKMGGMELSEKTKALRNSTQFLFLSGHTEDVLIQQGVNSGTTHFLEKPFTIETLAGKVRYMLENP